MKISKLPYSKLIPYGGSLLLLLSVITACTPSNSDKNGKIKLISVSSILSSEQSNHEKAEEIALAAESLLGAESYKESYALALQALNLDAQNLRATFIKATVAPFLVIKGIFTRVTPLAQKSEKLLKKLETKLEELRLKATTSKFHQFLLDGIPDIDSEEKLQLVLDDLIAALEQLRAFAKYSKSQTLTMKSNALISNQVLENYVNLCEVKIIEEKMKYELICPENQLLSDVKFNRADFELIQHYAAGKIADLSLLSAYDLTGSVSVHYEKTKDLGTITTNQQVYEKLLSNKRFGTLKNAAYLTKIKDLGLDAMLSLLGARGNQNEVCPTGDGRSSKNRVGMFFSKGFCMDAWSQSETINTVTNILSGGYYSAYLKNEYNNNNYYNNNYYNNNYYNNNYNNNSSTITMLPLQLFNQPLSDIRSLGLMQFDNCGHLVSVEEVTMGGTFPSKDANKYLELTRSHCSR